MERIEINIATGEQKTIPLTAEEIAALPPLPTAEEIEAQRIARMNDYRRAAYREEADPLFFKWQRGEATEQVWLDKIAEIKQRYGDV